MLTAIGIAIDFADKHQEWMEQNNLDRRKSINAIEEVLRMGVEENHKPEEIYHSICSAYGLNPVNPDNQNLLITIKNYWNE
jgi:hypothetical protein